MVIIPSNGYRSASIVASLAVLLFVALCVTNVLATISLAAQIQLLEMARFGTVISAQHAAAHDARLRLIGAVELSLTFAAGITLLVWVYRVNRNAHTFGTEGMSYSPGWSVGWFFMPLANLYMPFKVLRELWQVATPGAGTQWRKAPISPLVAAWWIACLVRGVIQYSPWPFVTGHLRFTYVQTLGPHWVNSMWEFSWGLLIAEIVEIASNFLTIALIINLTNLQERKRFLLFDWEEQASASGRLLDTSVSVFRGPADKPWS